MHSDAYQLKPIIFKFSILRSVAGSRWRSMLFSSIKDSSEESWFISAKKETEALIFRAGSHKRFFAQAHTAVAWKTAVSLCFSPLEMFGQEGFMFPGYRSSILMM